MQQMQLWIFWAIAAGIHNLRLHPHAATNGNLAASGAEQHVPALTTSHDQLAVLRPAFFLFLSLCGQLSQKTTPSGSDKRCCLFTVGSSYFHGPILDRIRPANRAASKFSCDLFPKDRFFHVHNFNRGCARRTSSAGLWFPKQERGSKPQHVAKRYTITGARSAIAGLN
jgi:hypothetical protein